DTAPAGARGISGAVALLARLVDEVVAAAWGRGGWRRGAGAVGAAAAGAARAVGPVALLARLVHLLVAAHGAGEVRRPVDADTGAGGARRGHFHQRVGGLARPVVDDGRGVAGVAVRDEELRVVEGRALEAYPVVGQRLQEGDDRRPAIRLPDEAADAVVEGVRPGRRLPLLDRLHAGAEVVRARRGERRARVALGALTAPFEGGEPVVLRRGQGGAPQLDAIEEAVVGDEGGLVELDRQPEEEREVLLHHRELPGGGRRAGGSGDGPDAPWERHDLVRVPPLGVEGRLDQPHVRLRQAARAGRRAAPSERAEHAVGRIDPLLGERREAEHLLADLVDRPAGAGQGEVAPEHGDRLRGEARGKDRDRNRH